MAGILVNGAPRDLDGVPLHTNALDFLRGCGLTGAKEGCAEGECGACSVLVARPAPDGSEATEWTAINSCLVPGRVAGRPGGRHVRGARLARRAAPGPARDGGARRLAVRLLHARVRLQHGRRVLPVRPRRHQRHRPHDDDYHGDNGFDLHADQRQPVPLHRLPADQGRRVRARLPGRRRRARRPAYDARAGGRRPPGWTTARRRSSGRRRWPRRSGCSTTSPDAVVVAGSTDWGVDVNLKGARAGPWSPSTGSPELRGFSVGRRRGPDRRRRSR